jgi:hypothetical protein
VAVEVVVELLQEHRLVLPSAELPVVEQAVAQHPEEADNHLNSIIDLLLSSLNQAQN